ncbi:hypothetical protein PIB30_023010 [Stylosanthes scabra]|uniref:DUF7036 domain-containing protein n=1 Tax=Stylosanthes scabra TaxID=79078 RepID=A0ABU6U8G8_9FABA|nr:hypothetical protein [Stylosanthes scabra]
MGKQEQEQYLQQQQRNNAQQQRPSSGIVCHGCSLLLGAISFKCLFVLILSLSALLSGIFWILPNYAHKLSYDAKDQIKNSASVQASFRLDKPISELLPYIERLEYDIFAEIGLPNTKVAVLSMHQSVQPNWTDVVFGVLAVPMNVSIDPVHLSVLRSSFLDLFLQNINLTLTKSIFGNASIFEILKFSGGLTVIPVQSTSIWQKPEVLFNFTLYNSTSEVLGNVDDLKDELKSGLHLKSNENVFVQITSVRGSTVAPPVTVQASVMPGFGSLLPERLKQLAEILKGPAAKNLGLDNSIFGNVKQIMLSSVLRDTLHATSPSPSPAPSPSISPEVAPSRPPISSPTVEQPPCFDCEVSAPASAPAPAPSAIILPPDPCPYSELYPSRPSRKYYSPPAPTPTSHSASRNTKKVPDVSPEDQVSRGSKLLQHEVISRRLMSHSLAQSSISSASGDFHSKIFLLGFCMLLVSFVFLNDITF